FGRGVREPHHLGSRSCSGHDSPRSNLIWRFNRPNATHHHIFNTSRASSDIRLGSHGGSQTTSTLVSLTPGTLETAFSTKIGSSCADGQFGEVSDMSILTPRSSAISTL